MPSKLLSSLIDVFSRTWYLGLTSFGGPVVHFQIFHRKFVEGSNPWIDEQTYQELFAICQALPGPASTKIGFCIALLRGGILSAALFFLTWSLPGAIGMCALALGVSRISSTLPLPVYALLSGLNASVVGVIAFAAVQLARKAITDKLSRIIVVFSACAGLCYNALWYFPVLMVVGGTSTVVWDLWARSSVARLKVRWKRRGRIDDLPLEIPAENLATGSMTKSVPEAVSRVSRGIPVKVGLAIIVAFVASFIAIMVANAVTMSPPLGLRLFRNMYLAGTIIFGGGPVVIPLLREYVVHPGFVSPRDFLIGLAIIQAFPGPNFNFAVYLGTLTLSHTSTSSVVGAILGYLGIFTPGLILVVGFQALWHAVRSRPFVTALLRGVNAAAVGLVYTAVYRLWEIGYLTPGQESGSSLGAEPWWVVIAVIAYTSTAWFGVETWVGIVAGAALGLCWYGAVKPWSGK